MPNCADMFVLTDSTAVGFSYENASAAPNAVLVRPGIQPDMDSITFAPACGRTEFAAKYCHRPLPFTASRIWTIVRSMVAPPTNNNAHVARTRAWVKRARALVGAIIWCAAAACCAATATCCAAMSVCAPAIFALKTVCRATRLRFPGVGADRASPMISSRSSPIVSRPMSSGIIVCFPLRPARVDGVGPARHDIAHGVIRSHV
jgi:hypothetical protein